MNITQRKEILDKVAYERWAIEDAIENISIPSKLLDVAQQHASLPVFSGAVDTTYTTWKTYTFSDLKSIAFEVAAALLSLGIKKNDVVQIIASPRVEHHLIDYGILCSGAITCSLYRQLKATELSYIESLTETTVLFVGKTSLLNEFLSIETSKTAVKHIVFLENDSAIIDPRLMDYQDFHQLGKEQLKIHPNCVNQAIAGINSDDIAEIIFTSGTTGKPKGVMLSHSNILSNSYASFKYFNLAPGLKQLSFLPLAHVFARSAEQYSPLFLLSHIYCVPDLNDVKRALVQVKPDLFCAVPRLFEKIQNGLLQKIKESGKENLVAFGFKVGLYCLEKKIKHKTPNILASAIYKLYKTFIFKKILHALGLEKLKFVVTGGGAINPTLHKWFSVLGVDLVQGYGLTETSPVIAVQIPKVAVKNIESTYKISLPKIQSYGSTGIPLAGTKILIKEDGEIAIKGPQVFHGYYKNEDKTAAVFDDNGWFLTGDYGKISDYGELIISGRKKEILVTSGGKNISPLKIENLLTQCSLIGQAIAIGDDQQYVTAILSLDQETALYEWAEKNGWEYDLYKLSKNPALIYEIENHVLKCNKELQNFETIKKFILVSEEWKPENGLLTPTMKMKRFHIKKKYEKEIQKLYSNKHIQARLDTRPSSES